jgi:Asp-tRNA(Asn)/Glu-tRNA(Gln) amidotransferase A subunit family amidase
MGFSRDGLPLSLQIVGRPWGEAEILGIADAYEAATPQVRARRPPCA